jgi:hypothetical protein
MTTEERLGNLERELARAKRRNRWLVAVVGLVVVGLILAWTWNKTTSTAQAQAVGGAEKVIRANKFILEDANGKERAMLTMTKEGPALTLFDENGGPRVVLSALKEGPKLNLADEKGKVIWAAGGADGVAAKTPSDVEAAPQWRPCPRCNGSGNSSRVCSSCEGTGIANRIHAPSKCLKCNGKKFEPCMRCDGKGMVGD